MTLKEKILWTTNLLRNKTLLGITWKLKLYYSYMKHVWGKYDLEKSRKINKENLINKQVENLINKTPLNPILRIFSVTTQWRGQVLCYNQFTKY